MKSLFVKIMKNPSVNAIFYSLLLSYLIALIICTFNINIEMSNELVVIMPFIFWGLIIVIYILEEISFLIEDTALKLYTNESVKRKRIEKIIIFFLKHDYFMKSVMQQIKEHENNEYTYLGPI